MPGAEGQEILQPLLRKHVQSTVHRLRVASRVLLGQIMQRLEVLAADPQLAAERRLLGSVVGGAQPRFVRRPKTMERIPPLDSLALLAEP